MTQAHDSFDQSPHGVFVQTQHGDARNAPEDFVIGIHPSGLKFTDATEPDRTIFISAYIDAAGKLYSFGTNNDDFNGGYIQDFEEYKGKLYAGGPELRRPAIANHSEEIFGQMVYNKAINDWDRVGAYAGDSFGGAPYILFLKVAKAHNTLVLSGNNGDGWSNDESATFVAQTKQLVGWNGVAYFDICGTYAGDIFAEQSVAKYNNTVISYLVNSSPFENAQVRQWDGGTAWTQIGPNQTVFGAGNVTIFDSIKTTLNGVNGEYIFAALDGGSSEQRYWDGVAWTIFTTLGDYDITQVDKVVKYKDGVVLFGTFSLTAAPFTATTALYWRDDDNDAAVVTEFAASDPITPVESVNDVITISNSKKLYVASTVTDDISHKFGGFGIYNLTNDDYDIAWQENTEYSDYDIIDAIGVFESIGRFDIGKLKKTDPQP